MNIINDPYATRATGWASTLGQGLGAGVNALVDSRIKTLQQRAYAKQLEAAGFNPQQATLLSASSEAMQPRLMDRMISNAQAAQVAGAQPEAQPSSLVSALQQDSVPVTAQQVTSALPSMEAFRAMEPRVTEGYQRYPGIDQGTMKQLQAAGLAQAALPQRQPVIQQQAPMMQAQPIAQQPMMAQQGQPLTLEQQQRAKLLSTWGAPKNAMMEQRERHHQDLMAAKRESLDLQREKFQAKPMAALVEAKQANRKTIETLNKLQDLSEKNEVNSPEYMAGLNALGLDNWQFLTKPGTQEFNTLQAHFFTNFKRYFGARPTQWEVSQAMKKFPNLMQTKDGRRLVINDLKIGEQAEMAFLQAKEDIIKENKGKMPADLDIQADQRSAAKVDKLWNKFRTDFGIKTFNSPSEIPADQYNGRTIVDKTTGKKLRSNGTSWEEVQ